MTDRIWGEQPLPPKAEHLPPTDARQARVTGRVGYIPMTSVVMVVVAFAIIYFIYA